MLSPDRALNIYRDYERGKTTPTLLARRYGINYETILRILTSTHRHTRHLPPLWTVGQPGAHHQ